MKPTPAACIHCGTSIPSNFDSQQFCCRGCEFVWQLIQQSQLEKFYHLKDSQIRPVRQDWQRLSDTAWLSTVPGYESGNVQLAVEGIQCVACVWLIQALAKRSNIARCSIDSVAATLTLRFDPSKVDPHAWVRQVEQFGYRLGKAHQRLRERDLPLLLRLGVLSAISMNSMTLSLCFYLGLDRSEPELFRFFHQLNLLLAIGGVAFGGTYFFKRAWVGLKMRLLHFDTTVSIGILAGLVTSSYNLWRGHHELTYFDSLNGFIALMLLGRFVQNRTIEKQQMMLLKHTPFSQQLAYVVRQGKVAPVTFQELQAGERILLASGDIVPTHACLNSPPEVDLGLQWIQGESAPKRFAIGDPLPAGAQLISDQAAEVTTMEPFANSQLSLLEPANAAQDPLPKVWEAVTRWYVPTVLGTALLGFLLWAPDWQRALQVAIAVTVVTCPCALGIAVPLARNLGNRLLARQGVLVRTTYLFERLQGLRRVIFDKTGTLTLAELCLQNRAVLQTLSAKESAVLLAGVARSRHPVCRAIFTELAPQTMPLPQVEVRETPGVGLTIVDENITYFLGRGKSTTEFRRADQLLAEFHFTEEPVAGLSAVVDWLKKQGIVSYLCSGDSSARVHHFAQQAGIEPQNVMAQASPQQKAEFVAAFGPQGSLYLGDGINDILAMRQAELAGAVGSNPGASLNAGSQFVYLSNRLDWLKSLLLIAERFRQTWRANIIFIFSYNALTLGLALSGHIHPLLAAILMPTSSLVIVAWSLRLMKR